MAKKSVIEEIFSKARFADEPKTYRILYRDGHIIKESSLLEFLIQSNNFQTISISRIKKIKKGNTILFEKNVARDE